MNNAYATQNCQTWGNRDIIFEINTFPNNSLPTVIYRDENAVLGKNAMLKVSIVAASTAISMPHLLHASKRKCTGGILCWTYPFRNGSLGTEREATCCVGMVIVS